MLFFSHHPLDVPWKSKCSSSESTWFERLQRNLFYTLLLSTYFPYLNLSRRKGKLFFSFNLISCWMDTFAHFRWSEELHNNEIAIAYSSIKPTSKYTSERSAEKIERNMLENWKCFFSHNLVSLVLSNEFSLKPYFQFGFWFSWFKLLSNSSVQKKKKGRKSSQNVNLCAAVSGIIIWDKLIMSIFVTRIVSLFTVEQGYRLIRMS